MFESDLERVISVSAAKLVRLGSNWYIFVGLYEAIEWLFERE